MTTTVTEQEEPQEPEDTTTAAQSEVLRWAHPGGDSDEIPEHINLGAMRRRLPRLVRTSFALAWQVDRRRTALLMVCQLAWGLLSALGLLAGRIRVTGARRSRRRPGA